MSASPTFSGYYPRQTVTLIVGDRAHRTQISASVATAQPDSVEIKLNSTPRGDVLAVGVLVGVISPTGRCECVEVASYQATPEPSVVLRSPIRAEEANRRAHPRVSMEGKEISVTVRSEGEMIRLKAQLLDLSLGGAKLMLGWPVANGDTVYLSMPRPEGGAPVSVQGRTAWAGKATGGWQVGVQFAPLTPAARELLGRLTVGDTARRAARPAATATT